MKNLLLFFLSITIVAPVFSQSADLRTGSFPNLSLTAGAGANQDVGIFLNRSDGNENSLVYYNRFDQGGIITLNQSAWRAGLQGSNNYVIQDFTSTFGFPGTVSTFNVFEAVTSGNTTVRSEVDVRLEGGDDAVVTASDDVILDADDDFFLTADDDMFFRTSTSSTTRMTINELGRVGIATTGPESDLHINQSGGSGSSEGTGGICLENGTFRWRIYNSNDYVRFNYSSDDGSTYTAKAYVNSSDGSWNQLSDRSLKSNIENVTNVLPLVQQLEVKKYHYNDNSSSKKSIGLIAQEVEQIFPELVSKEKDADLLGINYSGFGVIAIQAIQEQQEIIEDLKKRIEELEKSK